MILDRDGFGIWSFIAKRAFKATFERPKQSQARDEILNTLDGNDIPIYIHIPFCRSLCRYCPYVRYPYNERKVREYVKALKSEIYTYGEFLDDLDLRVIDVHAGGGTPSILGEGDWREILEALAEIFDAEPKIAIEANPEDFASEDHAFKCVESGVNEVSLGIQSLDESTLKSLGRTHGAKKSVKSVENLREAGVEYINADMMYMIPGQSLDKWNSDLDGISRLDIDEITCYPTLMTSYSPGYKLVEAGKVGQPSKSEFKEMMYLAEEKLPPRGFEPVEIYGYSKEKEWKYVTVNYEMEGPLLGLGCGAVGFTGGYEWQNTCSISEYIRASSGEKLPIAGGRNVGAKESAIRYTSCRLFVCRNLDTADFKGKFGREFDELMGRSGFGMMLKFLKMIGLIKRKGKNLELTRRGLFAAHQNCWSFVLNIPCRMCEEFRKEPWPREVTIP